jgi:branched-chain amino acid transport system substrate-binding protein
MSEGEITAGISLSLSGRFRIQGQQALCGLLLWQSLVNAQGGITVGATDRRLVRLIWYDDFGQAHCARTNVFRLLREDKVHILFGPYSSGLTMSVAEIAEEYRKVLWNYGGSSDEIFRRGQRYLVGIASPASDYLRALPRWLAEECPTLSRICVLYSGRGSFAWHVARGFLQSALDVGRHSIHLVPVNVRWDDHETILAVLGGIAPEIVVLVGSLQDELSIMRIRDRWPAAVHAVAAIAAGVNVFSTELGPMADGVLGPSQWEPATASNPNILGPTSDWFSDTFEDKFNQPASYIAAGSFATGLVLMECIRRAATLDDEALRNAASDSDLNTFYGRFRIDARTGLQTGHRGFLIRWEGGRKVVLPATTSTPALNC